MERYTEVENYEVSNFGNVGYDMDHSKRTTFKKHHTKITLTKYWIDHKNETKTSLLNYQFNLKTLRLCTIEIPQKNRIADTSYSTKEIKKMKIPYGTTVFDGGYNRLNLSNYDKIYKSIREASKRESEEMIRRGNFKKVCISIRHWGFKKQYIQ